MAVAPLMCCNRLPALQLVKLFSPEHGLLGNVDRKVDSFLDERTGLMVFSLYGEYRRPTSEMLNGVDALVFDIQDIGARFYTYISTMGYAMEEAAKAGIRFLVLDRPNPINGVQMEGPLLEPSRLSFTGYFPLPVRHGLTVGELALLFNGENRLGANLEVVKIEGWRRSTLARRDRPRLGESFAEHPQSSPGNALHGSWIAGIGECFRWPGHGNAFRSPRGSLDQCHPSRSQPQSP